VRVEELVDKTKARGIISSFVTGCPYGSVVQGLERQYFKKKAWRSSGWNTASTPRNRRPKNRSRASRRSSKCWPVMDLRGIVSLSPGFDVVVASLSLHYFNRKDTVTIFQDVRRLLNPSGILAFRVNAFDDVESGAQADAESWTRVSVDGVSKQFFTLEKIATVLQGSWRILSQEKLTTQRYGYRKSIFEVIAQVQK
jgi:SAM-dependent methyltransferase